MSFSFRSRGQGRAGAAGGRGLVVTWSGRHRRRERLGRFSSLGSASFGKHLSARRANLLAFVPSQAGDNRDMSRELQDVDLAEVKPLVEKGEVSGDARSHMYTHVCTV